MRARKIAQSISVAVAAAALGAGAAHAAGEPKNEAPFVTPVTVTTVSGDSGGFSWVDGGIGLAAGFALCAAGGAAVSLARRVPRLA